jgi:hypothetical protein
MRSAPLAIELGKRPIADPFVGERIDGITLLEAQPKGQRGLTNHVIDSARSTFHRPKASSQVLRDETTAPPYRTTHDVDAN